jgi:hypothetical protein
VLIDACILIARFEASAFQNRISDSIRSYYLDCDYFEACKSIFFEDTKIESRQAHREIRRKLRIISSLIRHTLMTIARILTATNERNCCLSKTRRRVYDCCCVCITNRLVRRYTIRRATSTCVSCNCAFPHKSVELSGKLVGQKAN